MATVDKRTNTNNKKAHGLNQGGGQGLSQNKDQDQHQEDQGQDQTKYEQQSGNREDHKSVYENNSHNKNYHDPKNNNDWSYNRNKPSYNKNRNNNENDDGNYPKKSYSNEYRGQGQGQGQGQSYYRNQDQESHNNYGNNRNNKRNNNKNTSQSKSNDYNNQKCDTQSQCVPKESHNSYTQKNNYADPDPYLKEEIINPMTTIKENDEENIEDIVRIDDQNNDQNKKKEKTGDENNNNNDKNDDLPEFVDDFEKMNLSLDLMKGVFGYGFKYPSPIQSRTIHIINNGHDLIAQSQSGSGKTGAFAIGSLSNIDVTKRYPQVLILANTRILADQIMKVTQNISMYMNIEISLCVGGGTGQKNNGHSNTQQLKTSQVLIGTPGRICDMLSNNVFDGKKIRTLIMDESDALLKDDFRPQIIEIISKIGAKTQICIFSATYTKETLQTTENFLRNPYRITIEKEDLSVKNVKQYRIDVQYEIYKLATLRDIFTKLTISQMIIFVNSIRSAEELRNKLMDNDVQAGMIHGKMSSIDRENVLKEFRLSYIKILISTDVMCRGIDIDDLRIVINYDMADYPDTYIHRVGRSGRYGGQGIAINFCTYDDYHKIRTLERDYGVLIRSMPNPNEVNEYLTGMKPPDGKVLSSKNYD